MYNGSASHHLSISKVQNATLKYFQFPRNYFQHFWFSSLRKYKKYQKKKKKLLYLKQMKPSLITRNITQFWISIKKICRQWMGWCRQIWVSTFKTLYDIKSKRKKKKGYSKVWEYWSLHELPKWLLDHLFNLFLPKPTPLMMHLNQWQWWENQPIHT